MINTYQTSVAAPPVPPRLSRSQQVLFPAPSQGHSKSLLRFLTGVVVLHLFLSVGGFIYLKQNDTMHPSQLPSAEGKTAHRSSGKQETSNKALARMVVKKSDQKGAGYLEWDMGHSVLKSVSYSHKMWLTIEQPGDYYVYSRVTFSKLDPKRPLVSIVKLRESEKGKEKTVMQAFCNMDSSGAPQLSTATQGELVTLEKGNQLGVWLHNLSVVSYEDGATTFGIFRL
ncbi:CD40 ligand [Notothenia coriiceps]|uniref:CD40 ligand n=1 Tax=Notothenia coriiceps TaxID=8208 RepID=A0A6I9P0P7_9TELE|nr:PREDICTED: tumor necrosis factor ligand superfamily member 15-like [Notothenia coriiceps]